MGKRSVKANKNIYQLAREAAGLTREKASEKMVYISDDRIEKIESEKLFPHPDEVITMAECYKKMDLCNYYCTHECPIGMRYVPEVEMKDLQRITLEVVNSINTLSRRKDRLIEIAVDGVIAEDEKEDFSAIQDELTEIARSVQTLQIWLDQMHAEGKM